MSMTSQGFNTSKASSVTKYLYLDHDHLEGLKSITN
jgi:hypothetical protein